MEKKEFFFTRALSYMLVALIPIRVEGDAFLAE